MSSPTYKHIIVHATKLFAAKTYGDRPYIKHIMDVVENVEKYWAACGLTYYEFTVAWTAAWLHDAIEDTDETYVSILAMSGKDVADTVEAVTDRAGKNRKERHQNTYPLTAKHKIGTFLKLCDRLANVSAGGELNKMYAQEHAFFKDTLYRKEFASIQDAIDQALASWLAKL